MLQRDTAVATPIRPASPIPRTQHSFPGYHRVPLKLQKEGMKGVVRVLCGCHHISVESGRHACVHKAGQAGTREPADSDLQGVSSLIRLWSMVSVLTYPRRGPPPAPRPPLSRHSELPAAGPGTCWGGVRARVCVLTSLPLHQQAYTRCSCLLYTSPSPRDRTRSRMPSSA